MPLFSGPIETLLVAGVLVMAVAGWLRQRRQRRRSWGPRLARERDAVNLEVLEAAEREVRDLSVPPGPEEGFEGDGWGPGTARRPRSPLEL